MERVGPPLHRVVRTWWWTPWLVGALVALRLAAVAGLRLYAYFDSAEYDTLDFSGRWRRPWATPLLYKLVPGDDHRIVVAQALVGALCWAVLALAAAAWFRNARVAGAVAVAIGLLGCTTPITSWDAAKLSESSAISLTVLLVAAWLNLIRRPLPETAALSVAAALPWLFVRQSLLTCGYLLAAMAAFGAVVTWRRRGRAIPLAIAAAGLAVACVLATVSYGRNQEIVRDNLTVIVANRIAPDAERLAWFVDEGMPLPTSGGLDVASLRSDPAFVAWIAGDGPTTYATYLVTHPWYTLTEPLDDFVSVERPSVEDVDVQASMLAPADLYASSRPVVPDLAQRVLFEPGDTGTVLFALAAVSAWAIARRRRADRSWLVPGGLAVLSVASLYTGWHGATPELGRLGLIGAIGLRIALILTAAVLLEGELEAGGDNPTGPVDPTDQPNARSSNTGSPEPTRSPRPFPP